MDSTWTASFDLSVPPQRRQKRAPGGLSASQPGQRDARLAPHPVQNDESAKFSASHPEQRITVHARLATWLAGPYAPGARGANRVGARDGGIPPMVGGPS